MSSRYQTVKKFTPIIDSVTGKTRRFLHNRRVFSKDDIKENFTIHNLQSGQLLDELAFIYYGNEELWWIIADINQIEYPFDLIPGSTLTIPNLDVIEGRIK